MDHIPAAALLLYVAMMRWSCRKTSSFALIDFGLWQEAVCGDSVCYEGVKLRERSLVYGLVSCTDTLRDGEIFRWVSLQEDTVFVPVFCVWLLWCSLLSGIRVLKHLYTADVCLVYIHTCFFWPYLYVFHRKNLTPVMWYFSHTNPALTHTPRFIFAVVDFVKIKLLWNICSC